MSARVARDRSTPSRFGAGRPSPRPWAPRRRWRRGQEIPGEYAASSPRPTRPAGRRDRTATLDRTRRPIARRRAHRSSSARGRSFPGWLNSPDPCSPVIGILCRHTPAVNRQAGRCREHMICPLPRANEIRFSGRPPYAIGGKGATHALCFGRCGADHKRLYRPRRVGHLQSGVDEGRRFISGASTPPKGRAPLGVRPAASRRHTLAPEHPVHVPDGTEITRQGHRCECSHTR